MALSHTPFTEPLAPKEEEGLVVETPGRQDLGLTSDVWLSIPDRRAEASPRRRGVLS